MNIEEVRKANQRLQAYIKGVNDRVDDRELEVSIYGEQCLDIATELQCDEALLLTWANEELARRDAEAAGRALPITEEWLRVVMPDSRRSDERIWHSLQIKNDLYETHLLVRHVELSRFWAVLVQALEHDETLTEKVAFGDLKNRGHLLDLLAALKGGES